MRGFEKLRHLSNRPQGKKRMFPQLPGRESLLGLMRDLFESGKPDDDDLGGLEACGSGAPLPCNPPELPAKAAKDIPRSNE